MGRGFKKNVFISENVKALFVIFLVVEESPGLCFKHALDPKRKIIGDCRYRNLWDPH